MCVSHLGPLWNCWRRCMAGQGRKSPGLKESMPATSLREMGEVRRVQDTGSSHQTFTPTPKAPDVFGWNTWSRIGYFTDTVHPGLFYRYVREGFQQITKESVTTFHLGLPPPSPHPKFWPVSWKNPNFFSLTFIKQWNIFKSFLHVSAYS